MVKLWILHFLSKLSTRLVFRMVFGFWPAKTAAGECPVEEQAAVDRVLCAAAAAFLSVSNAEQGAAALTSMLINQTVDQAENKYPAGIQVAAKYRFRVMDTLYYQKNLFWFAYDLARAQGFAIRMNKVQAYAHYTGYVSHSVEPIW